MAAVDSDAESAVTTIASESDDQNDFNLIFGLSDEEEGLENNVLGFDTDGIAILNGEIEMPAPATNVNIASDSANGWVTVDDVQPSMPFCGDDGLKVPMTSTNPIDFFNLLFDMDFLDHIVLEINVYFHQQYPDITELPPHSRVRKWHDVTRDELKVFFALTIAMGLCQKPDIDNYWSTNEIDTTPFFGNYMSRDRYLILLQNLHLTNNAQNTVSDSIYHFILDIYFII